MEHKKTGKGTCQKQTDETLSSVTTPPASAVLVTTLHNPPTSRPCVDATPDNPSTKPKERCHARLT